MCSQLWNTIAGPGHCGRAYMKRESDKISGNDVYYTTSSILQVKNMLCSEFH